jgi:hypothetical protein
MDRSIEVIKEKALGCFRLYTLIHILVSGRIIKPREEVCSFAEMVQSFMDASAEIILLVLLSMITKYF